jgi:hypothetical protein
MTFQDFCDKYNQNLKNNVDAQKLFDFLATPSTIHNMMVFSQVGLPAISGIIPHLEQNFGNSPTFPLSDFRNRQTTGKMVKYILGFYGYTPQAGGFDERAKLRNFTKSQYFKTAAVYSLTDTPQYKIEVTSAPLTLKE